MKVAIVGSRNFPNPNEVRDYVLDKLHFQDTVISGGARGVDTIAEQTAIESLLGVVSYRVVDRGAGWFGIERWEFVGGDPVVAQVALVRDENKSDRARDFKGFGQAAYFRNGLIIDEADRVVAFWDGESSGTFNSIQLALDLGKPLEVPTP